MAGAALSIWRLWDRARKAAIEGEQVRARLRAVESLATEAAELAKRNDDRLGKVEGVAGALGRIEHALDALKQEVRDLAHRLVRLETLWESRKDK